tara:strand:- start:4436 stop:4633 length:198 start_codon:yes stop_codon:yes gene_type:complete
MKKYIVFADIVMSYSWTVEAGSKEDAVAQVKKELEEGTLTLGDGDLSEPTTDELYEWQADEEVAS